jgi:hypothetical protein
VSRIKGTLAHQGTVLQDQDKLLVISSPQELAICHRHLHYLRAIDDALLQINQPMSNFDQTPEQNGLDAQTTH